MGRTTDCDILLVKTDSKGDTLWTQTFGERGGSEDVGSCVLQSKDGGYIISGHKNGDLWLIKTDAEGIMLWDKIYGGVFYSSGNWVEETKDDGFIITGTLDQTYLWLIKTDENGDTTWSKKYEWGDYNETGYCVRQTSDSGYVIASNMGLFKTDSKGDSLWLKSFPSGCVEQTFEGGYIQITNHNKDIWIIKTDSYGDTVWTKTYGGENEEYGYDIHQTKDSGYVAIGTTRSFCIARGDAWLLRTDKNGDTLWTRTSYIADSTKGGEIFSGQSTSDGGYIMTGCSNLYSTDVWDMSDIWFLKTDSLGYVGIAEPIITPAQTDWQVLSPIGSTVTLRYSNLPQGFHAFVYDASGRKVDEIESQGESGTITWGQGVGVGVYFVRAESTHPSTKKVILIR